jgi:hypothetical protein
MVDEEFAVRVSLWCWVVGEVEYLESHFRPGDSGGCIAPRIQLERFEEGAGMTVASLPEMARLWPWHELEKPCLPYSQRHEQNLVLAWTMSEVKILVIPANLILDVGLVAGRTDA